MRTLYHQCLSPFCRKVRLMLGEKKLPFTLEDEPVWERRPQFLALNPAGDVPVLVEEGGLVLADSQAIVEYIEEIEPQPPLLGSDAKARAEVRRLVAWFDRKFHVEVTEALIGEKVIKRLRREGTPDSRAIRAGHLAIREHLEYISFLTDRRNWLAGDSLSLADIAAAAQLSTVDYIGDVPWDAFEAAKMWYMRFKSRPSFRPLLKDTIVGLPPVPAYAEVDF